MTLKTEVLVAGNNIGPTDFGGIGMMVKWRVLGTNYRQSIGRAIITVVRNILNTFTPTINDTVSIKRGTTTSTDHVSFIGRIVKINEREGFIELECRDPMWELKKQIFTKSYDIGVDPEAGVISDIWSDIVTDGGVTASAQSSGTVNVLDKYIANDDSRLERCDTLAQTLDWQQFYDYTNNRARLEEKGTTVYATALEVGSNIQNSPIWESDKTAMVNKIKIKGAVVIGDKTETFTGDGAVTSFALTEEPENTLVTVDAGAGAVEKLRGTIDATSTFDYTIDKNLKQLNFVVAPAAGADNVVIVYGYKVPMPIIGKNPTSIEDNGLQEDAFEFDDVKTVDDATLRLRKLLDNIGLPKLTTKLNVINQFDLSIGNQVTVIDSFNNRNETMIVNNIVQQWPEAFDVADVRDTRFDLDDFLDSISKRIKNLERKESVNETISNILFDFDNTVDIQNQLDIFTASPLADVLYWSDDNQGQWDNFKWNDGTAETETLSQRVHVNSIYWEDFYDDDLIDTDETTATVDTSAHTVTY